MLYHRSGTNIMLTKARSKKARTMLDQFNQYKALQEREFVKRYEKLWCRWKRWSIIAANIGSLSNLPVIDLEINEQYFEFVVTSTDFLANVRICVPWVEIVKIECHFSRALNALVLHVEEFWSIWCLIPQLKNAFARPIFWELDPTSRDKYKRVISLEFGEEPPSEHIRMMEHHLKKYRDTDPRYLTIDESCSSATTLIPDKFLPPLNPPHQTSQIMDHYLKKHQRDPRNHVINRLCSRAYIQEFLPPVPIHVMFSPKKSGEDVYVEDKRILLTYPPSPARPSVIIKYNDVMCLMAKEHLNDSILDFYLRYIQLELWTANLRVNTLIVRSCFYESVLANTFRNTNSETFNGILDIEEMAGHINQHFNEFLKILAQKLPKSEDIFSRDFIFVPIKEKDHWFLAIICYPWLMDPRYDDKNWQPPTNRTDISDGGSSVHDERDIDRVLSKREEHGTVPPMIKRPCILVYDSLAARGHEEVVNKLRGFLADEWNKMPGRFPRGFDKHNFPGFFVDGPSLTNLCDSGLFLLLFVEQFFETPIKDFRFPLKKRSWFRERNVANKRESIRKLLGKLFPKGTEIMTALLNARRDHPLLYVKEPECNCPLCSTENSSTSAHPCS